MIQMLNLYLHHPSDKMKDFLTCRFKSEGVIRVPVWRVKKKVLKPFDWCQNVVWIWVWDVSEKKKVLWHNLKDMDAVRSLLTPTRKIKLWCAVCQQSLVRRRKLPAVVSPHQCQLLASFFTWGWEQGSFRASSLTVDTFTNLAELPCHFSHSRCYLKFIMT